MEAQSMRAPPKTLRRARELRREMTLPEVVLWQALRKSRLAALRFRRQHPFGPYILDFYCAATRLAVEVDGVAHDAGARVLHDEQRSAWLAQRGINVLRFPAADVLRDETLNGILASPERYSRQYRGDRACRPSGARCARHPPRCGKPDDVQPAVITAATG